MNREPYKLRAAGPTAASEPPAFQALSSGLGLGRLRPAGGRNEASPAPTSATPKAPPTRTMPQPLPPSRAMPMSLGPMSFGGQQVAPAAHRVASPPIPPTRAARRGPVLGWPRLCLASGLDVVLVGGTVAVVMAAAVLMAAIRSGETEDWLSLKPMQWLINANTVELLVGIYGICLAYWLLFKLLVGRTVGEMLLIKRQRPQRAGVSQTKGKVIGGRLDTTELR